MSYFSQLDCKINHRFLKGGDSILNPKQTVKFLGKTIFRSWGLAESLIHSWGLMNVGWTQMNDASLKIRGIQNRTQYFTHSRTPANIRSTNWGQSVPALGPPVVLRNKTSLLIKSVLVSHSIQGTHQKTWCISLQSGYYWFPFYRSVYSSQEGMEIEEPI